jgi:hypothetical protein
MERLGQNLRERELMERNTFHELEREEIRKIEKR